MPQDGIVRSLVGFADQDITAVFGVFTDEQLNDVTSILDTFNIPTFVLNQLSRAPTSPYIFQTRPSVEYELQQLQRILDHYRWEQVGSLIHVSNF